MKRNLWFFVFSLLILFSACGDDKEEKIVEEEINIEISVFYTDPNNSSTQHVDYGSKVYFYFDTPDPNFQFCKYISEGKLINQRDNTEIMPDEFMSVDTDGVVVIVPNDDFETLAVIVESNHHEGRIVSSYFLNRNSPQKLKIIFNK